MSNLAIIFRSTLNFVCRFVGVVTGCPDADIGFDPDRFVILNDKPHFFAGAYGITIGTGFTNEARTGYTTSKPLFNEGNINPEFINQGGLV